MNFFEITKKDENSPARAAILHTAAGRVHTPAFLPIATRGGVKAVTMEEVKFWGAEIILANTYHLWQRPGDNLIRKQGGLHKFIGWSGPILTDSGGFQVFSLGEKRHVPLPKNPLLERGGWPEAGRGRDAHGRVLKISAKGVLFHSDLDGATRELTPEDSLNIQSNLGSDIALVLDYFPAYPFTKEGMRKAVQLTLQWAERSARHFEKIRAAGVNPAQRLFGIVQGGDFADLRKLCAEKLRAMDFAGYAIGGVAVGEPIDAMYRAVEMTVPHLEEDKPRHLLGVGTPEQLIGAVARGCDLFDCVLPTRNARHGTLFINNKNEGGYSILNIDNASFAEDGTPVDNTCNCYLCLRHTRAYLRHLFATRDPLAVRLATMHNLRFYLNLMEKIRRAIEYDTMSELLGGFRRSIV
ncbi:MAG: tRNA guanosine(34) transglycosylase Tgt [Candidatus Doudnabacteria bacterium]|nr:tRNA guanosine(34) transglycosylase Tgt [Candidatus Doudnabacteria bacterium]